MKKGRLLKSGLLNYFCLIKTFIGVPEKSHLSRILFSRNLLYGSFTYCGRFAKKTNVGTDGP